MKDQLQSALKEALKARDKTKLETIRSVLSAAQYEAIEKGIDDLPAEGYLNVLQREVKKRKEEIDFARQANRLELIEKLNAEISCLESFLPSQLDATKLEQILLAIKGENSSLNMGAAMKLLKERYAGQYDGKTASEVAKRVFG